MDLIDNSHLDLTQSYLTSSVYSQSTDLLNSRLSNVDMEKMEKENLLYKLLQLYQALENTQKDNQLLRIEKAQLRTELKNCKTKAQNFIQSNIIAAQSSQTPNSTRPKITINQSPTQSIQNCLMTPYESDQQKENYQKINKVFVKNHKRGISNNCITSQNEILAQQKKYYNTLMNSPTKQNSIKYQNQKLAQRQNSSNKLKFPKNKLNELIIMEREYDEKDEIQIENQTLQNFQSFYCPKKQDFNQTQRKGPFTKSMTKQNVIPTRNNWNDKPYQQYKYNEQQYYDEGTQRGGMNRSMSSSNLSNQKYCNSKGFKIPSSIQQIWGTSNNGLSNNGLSNNFMQKVSNANNKLSKLTKVNAITKAGLQRRTYLNC